MTPGWKLPMAEGHLAKSRSQWRRSCSGHESRARTKRSQGSRAVDRRFAAETAVTVVLVVVVVIVVAVEQVIVVVGLVQVVVAAIVVVVVVAVVVKK